MTTGATPLQDFDVLDDFATCATVPVLVATFAVLAAPPEDWQAPAWPSHALAVGGADAETEQPCPGHREVVRRARARRLGVHAQHGQTDLLVGVRAQRIENVGLQALQRAVLRLARRRVDGDHVVAEQANRRDVAVVRAVGVALAAGAADDDVLARVTAIGIGGQRTLGARVDVDAGDRALTVRIRAVRRRLYRRIGCRRACLGVLSGRLLEARLRLLDEGGSLLTGLLNGALQPGLQLLARLHKGFARTSKVARAE